MNIRLAPLYLFIWLKHVETRICFQRIYLGRTQKTSEAEALPTAGYLPTPLTKLTSVKPGHACCGKLQSAACFFSEAILKL